MTGASNIQRGPAAVPGLLSMALFLAGCEEHASPHDGLCLAETTPITDIQGDDWYSPVAGTRHNVRGIATVVAGNGFYIESPSRGGVGKSRALFIADPELAETVETGQEWSIDGYVEELGERRDKMTSITRVQSSALCSGNQPLPVSPASLPLDNSAREALEGMRVAFGRSLFVSDVYSLYRGKLTLSAEAPLRVPTEDAPPGKASGRIAKENRERAIGVSLPNGKAPALASGSRVDRLTGVLGHDGREQVLLAEIAHAEALQEPATVPPPASGHLRVVNANLLNFFNGDGRGGGFPAERGAETPAEFHEQMARIRSAFSILKPDLLAVQELENDGYGPESAAASLLELLDRTGNGPFAIVLPDGNRLGSDVITVGLFYREAALEPIGPPHTLDSAPFSRLSRQPLVQLFRDRHSGERILAAVNHLKSKGSCPRDTSDENRDRGQGCWNPARDEAVGALLPWLKELAREARTDHILVLGDMNAYRMEDPIRRFRADGFTELVEQLSGLPQYSHRYFGRAGTLDYAFATPTLARFAVRAGIWHINADWPRNMVLPKPWLRMSDHDPVYVDFDFAPDP